MEFQSMKKVKLRKNKIPVNILQAMLNSQKELNKKYYPMVLKKLRLNKFDKEVLTNEYLTALIQEVCEARDLINWKGWKQSQHKVDALELKFEMIDIMHFLLTLFDIWEMDSAEIYKYYQAKNGENHSRIKRKY